MKSIQKITRLQLKINHKEVFILLAIVSSEPDYKLSLTLNKKFRISLKNISPIKITEPNGSEKAFSRFSDSNESSDMVFNLISNRSGKNFFMKKLKNVDYLFQVQHPDNETNISYITEQLRDIDTITAVFNIDLDKIKDKNLQYLIH